MSSPSLDDITKAEYKAGFVTDIEQETLPPGLSEDVVRIISAKKGEPDWMTEWRLKAYRHWLTMEEPKWPNVHYPPIDYQALSYFSAPKQKKDGPEEPRRGGPEAARDVREARGAAARAGQARGGRGRRRLRQRLRGHHVQGEAPGGGGHLLLVLRGGEGAPRPRAEVPGDRRPALRQLLRRPQRRGLLRRLLRLRPEGRALPDGAQHLLPDQRRQHRAVRADPARGRRGGLRQLPRGLHGAGARREPAARRGGRAGRPRRRADQVLDRPELVPRRQGRQGRDLQLRDEAGQVRGAALQDLLDAGRDRLRHHLEVPLLHPAGRRLGGRVLLGRGRRTTCSRRTPAPR